ncbi:hypothetical protein V5799_019123 [Amblyomma americanum]|uniref:Uncharacterized protein n=1 Tax=Amblyomma americanum TaxID=6943 RepID=A0AAQ4EXF1_AMBAM
MREYRLPGAAASRPPRDRQVEQDIGWGPTHRLLCGADSAGKGPGCHRFIMVAEFLHLGARPGAVLLLPLPAASDDL